MILLINICKEKLHYYEFVKPIEDILKKAKIEFFVKHYNELNEKELNKADKIIICGTSLKDNEFMENPGKFEWIKDFDRPIIGICGGMQLIGRIFKCEIKKKTEIGFFNENFKNFLGLDGEKEVYHLHNFYCKFDENFSKFTKSEIDQAVKHKDKQIYAVLFHPEVRQKEMIVKFAKI